MWTVPSLTEETFQSGEAGFSLFSGIAGWEVTHIFLTLDYDSRQASSGTGRRRVLGGVSGPSGHH